MTRPSWRAIEAEAERRQKLEARCPRAAALRDRCVGAEPFVNEAGQVRLVVLLSHLAWFLDHGIEIRDEQAESIENELERMGAGKFPRPEARLS